MPDEQKPDSTVERWADKIMRWLTPLLLAYIATISTGNQDRGVEIERKVEDVHSSQHAVADTVKHDLDAKAADDAKATAINLYGTWKYLDENAVTLVEKIKAAEAKQAYESFKNKSQPKK